MRVVVSLVVVALAAALAYYLRRNSNSKANSSKPNWSPSWQSPKVFSPSQLAEFNGRNGSKSYLTIMGEVYDVTGSEHYEEDSGYYVFVGKDATAAFVTGDFANGEPNDDIANFTHEQLKGIEEWVVFYRDHDTYKFVGVVQGRYYGQDGRRTEEWTRVRASMASGKRKNKEAPAPEFPKCNMKWDSNQGSKVWCDFKGDVPRMGKANKQCVCVSLDKASARQDEFDRYANCPETSQECQT